MGNLATNVPEFRNKPSAGVVPVPDMIGWEHRTEENVYPMGQQTINEGANSWGRAFEPITLKKRGLTKKMLVRVTGSVTVANGTGAVTVRDIWPDGLIRMFNVMGNGAAIHHVGGWLLKAHIARRTRNANLSALVTNPFSASATPASGTYDYALTYEIPMCYDYATGVGAMYAESDSTTFSVDAQLATKDELFALTGTADVTFGGCTIKPTMIFFEAPRETVNNVDQLFLPDLSRLFQLQQREPEVNQTGPNEALALETPGNLVTAICAFRNNKANVRIGSGGLDYVGWGYGANLQPRLYQPTEHLEYENARLHNGLLPYKAFALDFDTENPRRDSTRPKSATEMGVRFGVPVATALSNARFYMLNEQLVAATNPVAAG